MRKTLIATLLVLAAALPPPVATADGLPIPVEDTGPTGIADPGGVYRYVSLDLGGETLVERTVQNGGAVSKTRILPGDYTIPAVGIDGSASGLSGDGETLVLIRPRTSYPRRSTEFVVLDTAGLRVRDRIALGGDFSFDAISPDGRAMYLIHYTSPRDYTHYEVRRYDLDRGRLVPGAITDPEEKPGEMFGLPISRQTSPSGRWAYTLYMGNDHPFVHALDTQRAAAVCIDLHPLEHVRDLSALGLETGPGPATLTVTRRGEPAALIDTESFEVSEPLAASESTPPPDDGSSVAIWALAAGALAAGAALWLASRRRGRDNGWPRWLTKPRPR